MHEAAGEQAIPSSGFSPEPFEVITRTGLKIAGLATGDAHDPPVLMLHGWLDNAASFGGVMPLLPGRRLLAIDLPGHGESDHLPSPSGRHFIDWITHVEDVPRGGLNEKIWATSEAVPMDQRKKTGIFHERSFASVPFKKTLFLAIYEKNGITTN